MFVKSKPKLSINHSMLGPDWCVSVRISAGRASMDADFNVSASKISGASGMFRARYRDAHQRNRDNMK